MFRSTRKESETPWRHNGVHPSLAKAPDELNTFLDELSEFIDSTEGDAAALKAELTKRVRRARGDARSLLRSAQDAGSAISHRAYETVNRGLEGSRDVVHQKPLSAVSIAAAGGLIVGLLLASRR